VKHVNVWSSGKVFILYPSMYIHFNSIPNETNIIDTLILYSSRLRLCRKYWCKNEDAEAAKCVRMCESSKDGGQIACIAIKLYVAI
jgi:hypothetical protein